VGPDLNDIVEQLTLDTNAAIGIPLALLGAVALSFGTQFQHRGVAKVEQMRGGSESGLSIGSVGALLARPSWVLGTALLAVAIALQLTSLWFAPLIVVQPLGAVALVITAILNARLSKTPLDGATIRAILLCVGGVGAFVAVAAFYAQSHPITETQLTIVLIALGGVLTVWAVLFAIFRKRASPMFYILAAGSIYGFVATLAKVIMGRIQTLLASEFQFGPAEWLTILCLVGLIVAAIIGMYFVQSAHANGPPDLVVAGLTVVDPIVAVAIGIIVLGEAQGAPIWAIVAFILTGAIAVFGVFQLAKHHPHMQDDAVAEKLDEIEQRLQR
jgi:hypothetical protein